MASSSEHGLSQATRSQITDDERWTFADETDSSPDIERPSVPLPTAANSVPIDGEITYPEGGCDAWLVVLGAWCGLTASLGIYNTAGVFEVVISESILPGESSSTLGWIFSIYAFVNWICGVQIGPTFDAMGPRGLLIAGTICTLIGIFALSFCTEYYQIVLSFSILTGIGSSLLLTPSMGCVAHWFMERRGLASGIAFVGGGFGGVLFPLMIQSLLPQVGWEWSIRILGFVLLVLCAMNVTFCRSRVPPRKGATTTWRDTLPDPQIFMDGTGAMAITTTGVLHTNFKMLNYSLTDLAYFIPITYMPSYYIDRQHLSQEEALTGSAAFAYRLLAILNAASCIGRCIAGDLADRFGRYNTMIVSLFLCTISVLCFWLPDVLLLNLSNDALLVIFVLLFGFVSGSNVSLTPICLGQLCETQEYGRYYASCFTVVAFGVLGSIPIAGGLLDVVEATGKERYWGAALFTGLSYVAALLCFIWVRIKVKGWGWRTKW
ncbi:putative riboflavin transporter mch5 protein [Botrytis fragariae]|uniref:Putative riboflavin transporter mch5 protein n=1 Tax=Botrytis fragariae TaxID=1964551 RepID=A0A8H6EEL6_9HELO|nr:putative riboflavin transporter mch5 protein [Botrytis fragariae]KAF5869447.1 putative riboflavin transporter mch5 protein [Botrytis fragariae]